MVEHKIKAHKTTPSAHEKLPPGPRGHFLLGNAREILRDAIGFNLSMLRHYGDVVRTRVITWPTYMVFRPDDVKHVLPENHRNYNKDVFNVKLLKPLLGQGLFTNDGESWLHQRRLMQPAFHLKHLATFGTLMTSAAIAMLEQWHNATESDQPLDIAEEMMRLTLRVAGQALFTIDLSNESDTVGQAFTAVRTLFSDYIFNPMPPLSIPTARNRRLQAAIHSLDKVVQIIISERRHHNTDRGDLLSMLMMARDEETGEDMNDRQLRDEVMTLLLHSLINQANDAALAGSTLIIAAIFRPARRRFQEIIDRRFYRHKYDAARIWAAFSVTLQSEVELNQICEELIAVVQETMQPAHISLWLRQPEHGTLGDVKHKELV